MAISATATKKETQFLWEGKDKRGNKVRGKSLAANEATLRADLRRQGVAATRVKTQSNAFRSGGKVENAGYRGIQPSARDHDVGRHPDGPGLRDHRQRPRKAGHAEVGAGHQGEHRGRQHAA